MAAAGLQDRGGGYCDGVDLARSVNRAPPDDLDGEEERCSARVAVGLRTLGTPT